jgi:phosphoglycerate dehydrogenase-like enzyme
MADQVLFCTDAFWAEHGVDVTAIDPSIKTVQLVGTDHIADAELDRITLAFFSPDTWPSRSTNFMGTCVRAPNLSWLQTFSAGTDHAVFNALRDRGVAVTNGSGASAPSIAQTVILYLLALSRDLPHVTRSQSKRRWDPTPSHDLHGTRLGIVGLGAIGTEVARLALAFGVEVIGLRRTVRGDEPCATWPNERFDELLDWADAIAVTAPLTNETRGLFDARAFARMRPGAWFMNVGRGEIVDETALVDALTSGHLGGAGLDVFVTEPLPTDSPLWTLPNVIVTPHSSGDTDRTKRRGIEIFLDNLRSYTAGGELANMTANELS